MRVGSQCGKGLCDSVLEEHLAMRLLQHLDLPMVHLAVVHVFLGEP